VLLGQIRCGTASHSRPAIEDNFFILWRFTEAETIFKLFFREEQGIRL
jgi:hypothetical protein